MNDDLKTGLDIDNERYIQQNEINPASNSENQMPSNSIHFDKKELEAFEKYLEKYKLTPEQEAKLAAAAQEFKEAMDRQLSEYEKTLQQQEEGPEDQEEFGRHR